MSRSRDAADQINRVNSSAADATAMTIDSSENISVTGNINLSTTNTYVTGAGHNVLQVDATKTYFYGGTGGVQFRTADNVSALVDISNSGNVGIGTTSPTVMLDVEGTSPIIRLTDSDASGTPECQISGAGGDLTFDADRDNEKGDSLISFRVDGSQRVIIDSSGNLSLANGASINTLSSTHSITVQGGAASAGGAIRFAGGTGDNDLRFYTSSSEKMRMNASGNVLIGKTAENNDEGIILYGNGTGYFIRNNSAVLLLNRLGSDGTVIQFYNDSNGVGSIQVSGSSTSYNTSSDYRLKTDAQPMTGASARVQALNPVNFEWIADGTRVDGFLAHEAQAVVPEAVTGTKDAMRDEEYEVTPAVYEDVVIDAVEEVLDEDGNVLTEAQPERTEQNLVTEAVMGTRIVPDMQGIDQSKMVPLLTAALQEALTKIDSLETRLTALEG